MKTRSRLLHVPGFPLTLEDLLPQHTLAALSVRLGNAGHETSIDDYGTLETVRAISSPAVRATASRYYEATVVNQSRSAQGRLSSYRLAQSLSVLMSQSRTAWIEQLAVQLSHESHLDFVVFSVNDRSGLQSSLQLAKKLQEKLGGVKRILLGRFADQFGGVIAEATDAFDAICVGDGEAALVAIADGFGGGSDWSRIPNLIYGSAGGVEHTSRACSMVLEPTPSEAYSADVYPALAHGGKFKLFTVEHSRGYYHAGHARPCMPYEGHRVRVKPVQKVCEELSSLSRRFGARAFHLSGEATPSAQLDSLAYEILAKRLTLRYSRASSIRCIDPATLHALHSSGCHAISVQLDTGSQRLLEDFYGQSFGVSQAETVLRGCRRAGMFVVVRLTYPCPLDDYHTTAETIRILSRCKPSATQVSSPLLVPGAAWHVRPEQFGFRFDAARLSRWAMSSENEVPTFEGADVPSPNRFSGWTRTRFTLAQRSLLSAIEEEGIMRRATEKEGLLAFMAGYGGREQEFIETVERFMLTADVGGLASLMDAFNKKATSTGNSMVYRSFTPAFAAVAN